jgi:uncharacterized protein YjbJ (UPF0337 family)
LTQALFTAIVIVFNQPSDQRRKKRMAEDKAKGKMKEAAGAITDDESKKAEGEAQQRKATAAEEAGQKERTRQEQAKAKEAEKERDSKERKDKGLLGDVGDTLKGR